MLHKNFFTFIFWRTKYSRKILNLLRLNNTHVGDKVRAGVVLKKQVHNLAVSLLGRLMERGVTKLILDVHPDLTLVQEELDHLDRSEVGCHVKRSVASLGLGVELRAIRGQDRGHVDTVLLQGK